MSHAGERGLPLYLTYGKEICFLCCTLLIKVASTSYLFKISLLLEKGIKRENYSSFLLTNVANECDLTYVVHYMF